MFIAYLAAFTCLLFVLLLIIIKQQTGANAAKAEGAMSLQHINSAPKWHDRRLTPNEYYRVVSPHRTGINKKPSQVGSQDRRLLSQVLLRVRCADFDVAVALFSFHTIYL